MKKPLSWLTVLLALGTIVYVALQLVQDRVYLERLNDVDGTTLIMVAVLALRGVAAQRGESDLQTVSLTLIVCVSFVFGFEVLYKWSFYFFPWRMPPAELREFVVQAGVSLVALAGFAQGKLRFSKGSLVALGVFVVLWVFWLGVGFPQLWDGQVRYVAWLPLRLSWNAIYVLNRCAKAAFMFVFYFLYGSP